mgnify:CR=1 FL=1
MRYIRFPVFQVFSPYQAGVCWPESCPAMMHRAIAMPHRRWHDAGFSSDCFRRERPSFTPEPAVPWTASYDRVAAIIAIRAD